MSSLIFNVTLLIKILFISLASNAQSHEINPAIADILQKKDGVQLEIRLNLEALLSGIDLSNVSNTDEAKQSAKYDFYRGRTDIDLKSDFSEIWPSLETEIKIKQDNELVALRLKNIIIEGQKNFDYPRFSTIVFVASVDPYRPFSFQWSKVYGDIVLRGQGSVNGFTQYLQAGIKVPILLLVNSQNTNFQRYFLSISPLALPISSQKDWTIYFLSLAYFFYQQN